MQESKVALNVGWENEVLTQLTPFQHEYNLYSMRYYLPSKATGNDTSQANAEAINILSDAYDCGLNDPMVPPCFFNQRQKRDETDMQVGFRPSPTMKPNTLPKSPLGCIAMKITVRPPP
jgi:hypothetical protein